MSSSAASTSSRSASSCRVCNDSLVKGVTSAYTVNDLLRKRTEYRDRSMETFSKRMPG